jgi:hypothetical protein
MKQLKHLVLAVGVMAMCTSCTGLGSSSGRQKQIGTVGTGLWAPSGAVDLDIRSRNGSVTIKLDGDSEWVGFEVALTTGGATKEEAEARYALAKASAKAKLVDGVGHLDIVFPEPRHRNDGADVVVILPKLNGVKVKTSNGNVVISGATSGVNVDTSNGEIRVSLADEATGSVTLETSNANVFLSVGPTFVGSIELDTSNARIKVSDEGDRAKSIELDKSDGVIDLGPGPESVINTSNASIEVTIR